MISLPARIFFLARHSGEGRNPVTLSALGVTSDLIKRIHEHKTKTVPGFTASHRIHYLVWLEQHATMGTAISREKALKEWKRAWKIRLIEESNPYWRDLFDDIVHDAV